MGTQLVVTCQRRIQGNKHVYLTPYLLSCAMVSHWSKPTRNQRVRELIDVVHRGLPLSTQNKVETVSGGSNWRLILSILSNERSGWWSPGFMFN